MAVKVTWAPSVEPDIASYDLEWAADLVAPVWAFIANVPHNLSGPNYDPATSKFFYAHPTGTDSTY